ncbi:unnamed protein product [Prorocentrum cordatum]|uniref:Anaphase-promoting complex subunit 1 n=1 Tax=Prorocentrum cordatum TaxID=2364126 RepID=A0ABN9T2I7_9DINO|nr:unnamed protein product [Polarella glacialis]
MAELAERLRARRHLEQAAPRGAAPESEMETERELYQWGRAIRQRQRQIIQALSGETEPLRDQLSPERKLRERRSVVDSKGTLFHGDSAASAGEGPKREAEPSIDQWGRVSSSAPRPPRGGGEAVTAVSSASGRPFASGRLAAAASAVTREPTGPHSNVGSELMRKLQARRGVVDSEGSAWQKLPEPQPVVSRTTSEQTQPAVSRNVSGDAESSPRPRGDPTAQPVASRTGAPTAPAGAGGGGELAAALQKRRCAMEEPPSPEPAREAEGPGPRRVPARRPCQSQALPAGGAQGLPLPWERLRRGALTWACEFWAPRALLPPPEEGECRPGVLCLSGEGEVFVCAPAPAPAGAPEQEDYACLLVSFKAQLLLSVCRWSGSPHTVGLCTKGAADEGPRSVFGGPADQTALVARLESEGEAAAFLAALGGLLPWLSVAFLDAERPGSELAALPLFTEASTVAPGSERGDVDADAEASDSEEELSWHAWSQSGPWELPGGRAPSEPEEPPGAPVEKMDANDFLEELDRKLDTQAFLEELDRLAGFA